MKFLVEPKDDHARFLVELYANITFACTICGSEDTIETEEPVLSGTHYKVRCEQGHTTNGMPPKHLRNRGW